MSLVRSGEAARKPGRAQWISTRRHKPVKRSGGSNGGRPDKLLCVPPREDTQRAGAEWTLCHQRLHISKRSQMVDVRKTLLLPARLRHEPQGTRSPAT